MELLIMAGIAVILIGLWYYFVAVMALFPKNLDKTVAVLEKASTIRNTHGKHGQLIPVVTKYVYTYTVNGKKYKLKRETFRSKQHLHQRVPVVYLKKLPRYAYEHKFKGINEWVIGSFFILYGVLIFVAIFLTGG